MVTDVAERFEVNFLIDLFTFVMFVLMARAWPNVTGAPVTPRQAKLLRFLIIWSSAGLVLPSICLAMAFWLFTGQVSAAITIVLAIAWGFAVYHLVYQRKQRNS
jgi:hypothetical protein